MFLLQPLQPLGLIHAQPTVFFLPVVVRVVGEPELPTGVQYRKPFASFQLDRPQMLKDLFGRIPFLGHDHDLPLVAVQSLIHPGPNLPGQVINPHVVAEPCRHPISFFRLPGGSRHVKTLYTFSMCDFPMMIQRRT